MSESEAADWQRIGAQFLPYARALPDRILRHLRLLDGDYGGFPVVSEENLWVVKHHTIFQGYYFFHHLGIAAPKKTIYEGLKA